MALYSSSPPTPVSWSHFTAHCSSSSGPETESIWLQPQAHSISRHSSRGGLSHLFATPNASHSSCLVSEAIDHGSGSALRNEHAEARMGSMSSSSSFGRTFDRGQVSVLQSPYTGHASSCFVSVAPADLDSQSWRRSFAAVDSRTPMIRREGFDVNRSLRAEAALMCGQVETSEGKITEELAGFLVNTGGSWPPSFVGLDLSHSNAAWRQHHSSPDQILADAQSRHKIFKDPFIVKAFKLAEEAHRGSFRRSGELYLTHCVETAILLALAGAEATVVAAGILHDTLDDSNTDEAQIRAVFGDDVADLVVGVSKISQLSQLARDNNIASQTLEADRLRTMVLAMVDVRVVLIKLADRLHNMRTLDALPAEKQQRIANETLEILVPIANRLGIWSWKAEMEDLCFKFLKPAEYQGLAAKLAECCRGGVVLSAIEQLEKALRSSKVAFEDLCGRSKNLFSIYTKMKKKGRRIDEIYDVRGLRLIVRSEKDCYKALEVVQKLWQHIPGKLKDYIRQPKANGYQSLHIVVTGQDGLPLEVQIRTKEMHRHAEFGMAAHWRYKEGNERHSSFLLQRVEWARWILTWHSEIMDTKLRVSPSHIDLKSACPFPFHKTDCFHALPSSEDDPLFVIVLKGEKMIVEELPSGCRAADLVLQKKQEIEVNHRVVEDFEQKLMMGDVVEFVQDSSSRESVYVATMGGGVLPGKEEINSYREHILRMFSSDRSCKVDARKGFEMVKENTQIAGLT